MEIVILNALKLALEIVVKIALLLVEEIVQQYAEQVTVKEIAVVDVMDVQKNVKLVVEAIAQQIVGTLAQHM